jgi:tetratricopeptide (TPR) repeat protein
MKSTIESQLMRRHRKRLRNAVAFWFAIGIVAPTNREVIAQQSKGDLPASPWGHAVSGPQSSSLALPTIDSNDSNGHVLRQPTTNRSGSSPDGPLMIGPPAKPVPHSRPASVTLFGPVSPTSVRASQAVDKDNSEAVSPVSRTNVSAIKQRVAELEKQSIKETVSTDSLTQLNPSIAAPRSHAMTQKMQIDATSDLHRMPAGGLILESATPNAPELQAVGLGSTPHGRTERKTAAHPASIALDTIPSATSSPATNQPNTTLRNNADSYDESSMRRSTIATRVSYELLSNNFANRASAPSALEAPAGWSAVEQEVRSRLEKCDALLKRGAIMSARDEAVQGLRRLMITMDTHRGFAHSSPSLEEALTALKEEFDFQAMKGGGSPELISSYVGSHSTKALKGRPLDEVTSEIASQHYRSYARYQFVVAADRHPWTADLLYAYGKTLEKEAEWDAERSFALRNQAVVCYQAATQITPSQSDASNQLGFALIHLDRIGEAYEALASSIQQRPTASAWSNLAEVYRRRGSVAEADYAIQQASALTVNTPSFSYENPQVTEVDPATFAKYSPLPMLASGQTPQRTAAQPTPVPKTTKTSFFSKIFK